MQKTKKGDLNGMLIRVIEECSDVQKAICNLQRFGPYPINEATGICYDNIEDIQKEMKHVIHSFNELNKELSERDGPVRKFPQWGVEISNV